MTSTEYAVRNTQYSQGDHTMDEIRTDEIQEKLALLKEQIDAMRRRL